MEIDQLLSAWQDVLQRDEPLAVDMNLADVEEWDSLAQVGMAAFFERKLGIHVSSETLAQCKSVQDLLSLAGKA
ncbi:acyl carrier protein [uncultured Desulfovibrio sp.]|uniref:Acyl carrier protein n=1 Tax=Candidatus Desulfovibrio intestinavium TaxID=2838534 RepID=A0A9D2HQK7_9BACT|nr:acyl carrier protein [uncultured Desulfovibrio sp.]HJA80124.1 acyl carrier protein [Candidatus Desulfovibrio intestinavium]